jgi:zinc carboxypeptidase
VGEPGLQGGAVAADLATARPTVVLVAGVHAREWGGPDVVVFPQVNPDGRASSMHPDGNELWRTNRRPSPVGGVDVNRSYAWLWDFRRHFDPRALARGEVAVSDTRGEDTYHGPGAFSEPETH